MSKTLVFEELTVGEILGYADLSFCDAKYKYMAFGKDVKGAWKSIFDNASDYNQLRDALGLQERKRGIEAIAKYAKRHLRVSENEIEDLLNAHIPSYWLLTYSLTKEDLELEFEVMMGYLFERIQSKFRGTDMTIVRKKKNSKGKK